MIDSNILSKIQKLQALANSACNEAEAASAAAKVAELCAAHNLEIGAATLSREQESATDKPAILPFAKFPQWAAWLGQAVVDMFGVGWYHATAQEAVMRDGTCIGVRRAAVVRFYGLRDSVAGACVTFEYLIASVESLLRGYIRQGSVIGLKGMNDFRYGAAKRIKDEAAKLTAHRRQLHAASVDCQALVVLENRLVSQHAKAMKLRTVHRSTRARNVNHFNAGYSDAGRVDLHGARTSRMIGE